MGKVKGLLPEYCEGCEELDVIKAELAEAQKSLRDWFAGQALSGVIDLCKDDTLPAGDSRALHFAARAYRIADAMLSVRERSKPE
jgi:hypothetical protein